MTLFVYFPPCPFCLDCQFHPPTPGIPLSPGLDQQPSPVVCVPEPEGAGPAGTRLMAEADQRRYSSALDCAVKTVREGQGRLQGVAWVVRAPPVDNVFQAAAPRAADAKLGAVALG